MDIDKIRKRCLMLPHTTEQIQWGYDLVFKVDGKMFAVAPLEVAPTCLSFKCTAENFAELCERPNIIPAPYMARAQWVALQSTDAIPDDELGTLLEESYRLVWEKLPRNRREALSETRAGAASARRGAKKVHNSPKSKRAARKKSA